MAHGVRRLAAALAVGCAIGALIWLVWPTGGVPASGAQLLSSTNQVSSEEAPQLGSVVVPSMQTLDGDQQASDAESARHASPGAFVARVRSRTEFENLGAAGAARVARQAFPALIDQRDGGTPTLPAGEKLRRFSAENVAQISLPGHERGVVESIEPMAVRTSSGQFEPIDLGLKDDGSSFVPTTSPVAVQISKHLGGGVRASGSGVSLTPVGAKGEALGGSEGSVDGASVLYANTQADTDTLAKPTSGGFDLSSILRSEASPHALYYRVGLPSGASLVQHQRRGPVQIVSDGASLGMVTPPTAVDAAGTEVPVSMSVSGDLLTVNIPDTSGEVQYPLDVDPEYECPSEEGPEYYVCARENNLTGGVFPIETQNRHEGETNWVPIYSSEALSYSFKKQYNGFTEVQSWEIDPTRSYNAGEGVGLRYRTQGNSTIYNLEMTVEGENEPSQTETVVQYRYGPNEENHDNEFILDRGEKQERYKYEPLSMTSGYFKNPLETPRTNDVRLMDYTTKPESGEGFWTWLYNAHVYVAQEDSAHPETAPTSACEHCGFNKSSATITTEAGSRTNVLYGSGAWLSPYQGAFEVTLHDSGIGISRAIIGKVERRRWEEDKCLGIQCPETYTTAMTYNSEMANGEYSTKLYGEDAAGLYGENGAIIKVDASKPYNLGFTGMLEEGAEISAVPHKLTVHATDGKKPTPSSGIRSVSVSIDGGTPTELSGASCSEGECTATGTYTLDAENLSEGVHKLVISAVSNSGVPAEAKEFLFDVRHGSPVSVGPGSVDPTTGQLTLTASDVSLGGASGVSRSYQSRNLAGGTSGPLGPQWAMSVGGGEGLTVLSNGSVVLTSSSGGTTTFALNTKGELEAPKGDENLKIEDKASEHKYVLKDATAGSETVFEQPAGTQSTPPIYNDQFGAELSELQQPVGDAVSSSGDIWVAESGHDRLVEFSSAGTILNAYGTYGSGEGQFNVPWGVAINQSTGNVYVTDEGNDRVEEFSSSGSFLRSFGSYGSGVGQLYTPKGIAINASGDVWISDYSNNRIEEFSESGSFIETFGFGVSNGEEKFETCTSSCLAGKPGSGNGQFDGPMGLAFSGGNLYVAEYASNRVQELSGSGSYISKFGSSGSGNGQLAGPRGMAADAGTGNLYVADTGNDRVEEFTAAGAYVAKFGSAGSGTGQFSEDKGVAVSSSGGIYVTDEGNNRVQEWTRPTWWPTSVKGALPDHTTYTYATVEGSEGTTTMQPYEVISPPPAGVECGTKMEELKQGCRALTFKYASATTATGESESKWGEYKGHLTQVIFHGYNPSGKAMEEKVVAQYSYDKQGRLRAEWDPRVSPALKTTYGYDAEGHVTAMTPPGQESWAFTYGTIAGDSSFGRLLKVTRAPSSAGLWNGEAVESSEAPKLSGTPAVGIRMSVSNGVWSNSPVVYGYQWEDCNPEGKACTAILGATNENYTPISSDVGHTLVAEVTATNGDGSVIVASTASSTVLSKVGAYTQTVDSGYSLNAVSCIPSTTDCVLSDSAGKALYAANVSTSANATWKSWSGPSGESPSQAVDCPSSSLCLLADGKETAGGKLYYATSLGGSFSEAYSPAYGVDAISCASATFCIDGQDNYGYYRYSTSPASTSWTLEDQHETEGLALKAAFCLSSSFCAMGNSQGTVLIATSTSQIESSTWKETDVDGSSALNGIACTATTSCVAVDGAGNALKLTIESSGAATAVKHNIDGTTSLTAVTCSGSSTCVAVDASGNVFVSKNAGETWSKEYALGDKLTSVSCVSTSLCATADTTGNVTAFNPVGGTGTEGEYHAPQPGSTVEYHVPLSGTGLPTLTKEEVEKWGQKDSSEWEDNDPAEGVAIFPPDEPQGWPASKYTRATIDYINGKGLTVNTATPTGGIATTEYNELNEAVRTLSADNRAAAMKEGCISVTKKECKSAERSEKVDTKTEYNPSGSEIVKVLGPEHQVKLSTGAEVQARAVSHGYYDEGAKEAEEKYKETYDLVTRSTSGALLSNGEEKDIRTTASSYSGQEDLGWKLRKATSTTSDPAGLDLVHKTVYEEHENAKKEIESTGNVVETKTPAGNSEQVSPPSFSLHFGGSGTGNGQFKEPWADALDSSGNVWALDTGNDRVEKFSPTGSFDAAYGKEGSGNLQFKEPKGIAINQSTGNVYVSDTGNNRIEELSSAGAFVEVIGWGVSNEKAELEVCKASCKAGIAGSGNGQFSGPIGVTIDAHGNLWVVDSGNDRVEELSEAGAYVAQFGSKGSGNGQLTEPVGIAMSEGSLYVVDQGNDRVEQFSTSGAYMGQFGSKGSGAGQFNEPYGIASNPSTGVLYVCDTENDRMEEFSPAGKFLTEWGTWGSTHEQSWPRDVAVGATGDLYIIDHGADEVGEWIPPEAGGAHLSYSTQFGSKGTGNGQFSEPTYSAFDGKGNVWITDYANDRLEEFTAKGSFIASYGKEGSGAVQFSGPSGVAINKSTGNVYVADHWNNRVEELSSTGVYIASFGTSGSGALNEPLGVAIDSSGNLWVADRGNDRIVEFSSTGTYIAAYGKEGTGEVQFKSPAAIAFSGEDVYVADSANHRVEELTNKGAYVRAWGLEGDGSREFYTPEGIAADAAGNLYVSDINAGHVEEFSPAGAYKATFGTEGSGEGQFTNPEGVSIDAAGDLYVVDQGNNRIQIWDNNAQAAHDTQTIYYSAEANSTYPNCGKHPEWANLVCQTQSAAQPDHGLPELPVSTVSAYNIWDEAEKTEEKFGTGSKAVIRTKTETYDAAGRALTSEETASPATDTALPKVTDEYSASTGAIEKESTPEGTIKSKYNTVGQLTEYSDASGNVAKYVYEEGGDGRLEEVSEGKGEEAKSTQTFSYNTTTGLMEKLVDTAAGMTLAQGTFTASYDVEGKMTSEIYPNGMCANTAYNSVGEATSLEYIKTRNCSETGASVWFSDSVVPSIHGETLQQTSTLAKESYSYDNAGRLLETQETPAGKGCTTRLYAYDEEANRTSLTTRSPGTEGKCATEGGTVERHTYDEANRLIDEGVEYETFGNITKLPAADAGTGEGAHELKSTYYLDGQVATQEQNKELIDYKYDPAGRTLETASENVGTKAKTSVISHYAGTGDALTWTSEGTEKWTRNIPGIDGALDAVQESGKTPVLQLHDLHGDVVGTVGDSESETKLLSTYNSTEFGVPNEGKTPPKYAWLGAAGVSTETSFGSGVSTQSGASYVPQVARNLQTAPVIPPGAFPNGSPGTQFTAVPGAWTPGDQAEANHATEEAEAERQKTKEEEAAKALQQCREEGGCGAGEDPRCTITVAVGASISSTGKEWVYARGWGSCEGKSLPKYSELEVCLVERLEPVEGAEAPGFGTCDVAGSGFNPDNGEEAPRTTELYAHDHTKCESGVAYIGWIWLWVPGNTAEQKYTYEPWECGGSTELAIESFTWTFLENAGPPEDS